MAFSNSLCVLFVLLVQVVSVYSLIRNPLAGRIVTVVNDEATLSNVLLERIEEAALENIEKRGAFTICVGSGSTVKPLTKLKDSGKIDFSRFHVFFGNERTEGDKAGKCLEGAQDFVVACGIPAENVHGIPKGVAAMAAEAYVEQIKGLNQVTMSPPNKRSQLPSYDLVLLGTGSDGHCASLYPDSPQVMHSVDEEQRMLGVLVPGRSMYVESAGKGGITITLDGIQSAKMVLLAAGKAEQAEMVATALANPNCMSNTNCPAGMILPALDDVSGLSKVEWILTMESAKLLDL
jgi:6-phosphogluconolactonase